MDKFLQALRKLIRLAAAVIFWLNALAILQVRQPPIANWAKSFNLDPSEAAVILALGILSFFWSYGLIKFAIDLAYVYFFPFIALYNVVRFLLSAVMFTSRVLFGQKAMAPSAGAATATVQMTRAVTAQPVVSQESTKLLGTGPSIWKKIVTDMSRPFRQFTLLWCLLLLLTSHLTLFWIALLIVLAHLFRALLRILRFAVFSMSWLTQLEDKLKNYAEGLVGRILATREEEENPQNVGLRNTLAALTALKFGIGILQNRKRVAQWLFVLGLFVFGAIYLYLSTLFAFAYYGLARVQSIPYTWSEAFVASIFIPAAYGDLPPNVWLKTLGGLHWFFVVAIGIGTVVGYFQRKLDSLHAAADAIGTRLENEKVKQRIEELSGKLQVKQVSQGDVPKRPVNHKP